MSNQLYCEAADGFVKEGKAQIVRCEERPTEKYMGRWLCPKHLERAIAFHNGEFYEDNH
jgi:hypothetical protein